MVGDWGIIGLIEGVWRVAVKVISFFSNITHKISLYSIRNNFIAYSEVWAVWSASSQIAQGSVFWYPHSYLRFWYFVRFNFSQFWYGGHQWQSYQILERKNGCCFPVHLAVPLTCSLLCCCWFCYCSGMILSLCHHSRSWILDCDYSQSA
jgi:hypothetical protein